MVQLIDSSLPAMFGYTFIHYVSNVHRGNN